MASFNRVILVGNVTRDIELKWLPSGTAVAEIGVAVNHAWRDQKTNEKKEEVTFVDVTLFGRTAEIANEYLAKGRPVLIEGRLKLETWADRDTGSKRSKLKVIGEALQLLGSRDGGSGKPAAGAAQSTEDAAESYADEGSPF